MIQGESDCCYMFCIKTIIMHHATHKIILLLCFSCFPLPIHQQLACILYDINTIASSTATAPSTGLGLQIHVRCHRHALHVLTRPLRAVAARMGWCWFLRCSFHFDVGLCLSLSHAHITKLTSEALLNSDCSIMLI